MEMYPKNIDMNLMNANFNLILLNFQISDFCNFLERKMPRI